MSKKERALLVVVSTGAALAAICGFEHGGIGGALLGAGCVGGLVVFLERYWLVVFVACYLVGILYFWGVGL